MQVKQARVDGGVRVVHGDAFEGQFAGRIAVPDLDDDAVFDKDRAVVVHGAGIVHGHHAALEHVRPRVDVVEVGVAAQASDGGAHGGVFVSAGCRCVVLPKAAVVQRDVGSVPPAVLVGPAHRIDEGPFRGAEHRTVAAVVVQLKARIGTEDDDALVGLQDGVPRQAAGRRAAAFLVIEPPIGDVDRAVSGVPNLDELIRNASCHTVTVPIHAVVVFG